MVVEDPDYAAERHQMVEQDLRPRGITDPRVLDAMLHVPREVFVLPPDRPVAYSDQALPIPCGQTISQPYIVALMTQCLDLDGSERVLEIGSGSGYQTAILSRLCQEVIAVELQPELAMAAGERLRQLGCDNVRVECGDGAEGWSPGAPYDRILIAAAAEHCPPRLLDQLRIGGLLVAPFGSRSDQTLYVVRKTAQGLQYRPEIACRFVPFV